MSFDVLDFSTSDLALGGVISVAVSVLAILFAVKGKYSTAKWRGAGARCFWFSLLFILPTIIVEVLCEDLLSSISWGGTPFLRAFLTLNYYILCVGGAEEAGKILAVYTGTGGYHRMTSQNDILNYSLISAAAFTGFENILYYIRSHGDLATALVRAALSSPFHITCTMIIALGILRSMQEKNNGAKVGGVVLAVLIHGCYDFVADYVMSSELSALSAMFVLFMIVAMVFVVLNILKAPGRYAQAHSTSTCKRCGSSVSGFADRCRVCGAGALIRRVELPPMTFPKKPEPVYPQPMYYYPVQQMPYAPQSAPAQPYPQQDIRAYVPAAIALCQRSGIVSVTALQRELNLPYSSAEALAQEMRNRGLGVQPVPFDPTSGNTLQDSDELLPAAVEVIFRTGQAYVSVLQRQLNLGYARAVRIMDDLEQRGIVSPLEGASPRRILITREQWQAYLNNSQQ